MAIIRKIGSMFLRIGISAVFLYFVFRQIDTKLLFANIKNADKPLLAFAFIVFAAGYALCLLRWNMLLKALKMNLPFRRVAISYSGGIFFSLFLPSTIGGDFMRSIDLSAHTKRPKEVVATVFLDRLSGYIGLTILALVSISLGWRLFEDKSVLMPMGIICGVLILVLLVLFNKFVYSKINKLFDSPNAGKIRDAIRGVHEELHYFKHHKRVIVANIATSILVQLTGPLTFILLANALGIKANVLYFFVFIPIIGAITLLPISLGGLGLRDATMVYFFAKAGVPKDLSFAMSLVNFSFILTIGALGGLIYVLTVHHRRIQLNQPSVVHQIRS